MNPFTKGQKVRAIRDTESRGGNADIGAGAVLEVSHTSDDSGHLFNAWHPNGIDVYALAKDDFEPAEPTPAPLDPEPEWADGTVAEITYNNADNTEQFKTRALRGDNAWTPFADVSDLIMDDEVTDVRPLVVIDPADVNLNNLFQAFVARYSAAMHGPFGATEDEARRAGIDGVLADLGIEVAR